PKSGTTPKPIPSLILEKKENNISGLMEHLEFDGLIRFRMHFLLFQLYAFCIACASWDSEERGNLFGLLNFGLLLVFSEDRTSRGSTKDARSGSSNCISSTVEELEAAAGSCCGIELNGMRGGAMGWFPGDPWRRGASFFFF
ncbi:hypothetical protein NPIL_84511, partial [Nephila pilipes]